MDSDVLQSGRCDLHKGIRIEVTKEPFSMRSVANVIIALQRMKHTQRVQSTEFTDQDLFTIFMENVIEGVVQNISSYCTCIYSYFAPVIFLQSN